MKAVVSKVQAKVRDFLTRYRAWVEGNLWVQLWLSTVAVVLLASFLMASVVHFLIVPAVLDIPNDGPRGGPPLWPYIKDLTEAAVLSVLVGLAMYPVIRMRTQRLMQVMEQVHALKVGDFSPALHHQDKRDELSDLDAQLQDAKRHLGQLFGRHKDYLAQASHELRTPITRLHLGIEGLQAKLSSLQADTGAMPTQLLQMKRDVNELHQLVEDILLASKLDNPKLQPVFARIDLLALAAEEASHFNVECTGEIVFVQGDEVLLRRVVRNLLENAVKFAPLPSISMTVGASQGEHNSVCLEVRDEGEGIAQAQREKVFEPYTRLHPDVSGTGLGLALVREIAQLHGGTVAYRAHHPHGSVFSVHLPQQQNFT